MIKRGNFKWFAALIAAGLLALSAAAVNPSYGALPKLDNIRVALFLSFPGKYNLVTPAATLSSAGGLKIGFRNPDSTSQLVTVASGTNVRFALDDYKVKLIETPSFTNALAVFNAVKSASGSGYITSLGKNGTTVYQVTEGNYASAAEAAAASAKWSSNSSLKSLGAAIELAGPLHLESGTFSSQQEAEQAAQSFGDAGVDAFVALRQPPGENAARYSVMVGAASDQAGLDGVKLKAASAVGSDSLQAASADPYMLIRRDLTGTQKADSSIMQYMLPPTAAKVWVSPAGSEGLKLSERYNRTYRGNFEFSGMNGKLAVINELPFEQYLYSVVGAEMPGSWPAEALKAQAVAARTYALYQGTGFQIAQVVDTTLSQVYGGIGSEKTSTVKAVQATEGEVAVYNGALIESLFSSSSGGKTADATEIWNQGIAYLKSVDSPDDLSEKGLYRWYRIALPSGMTGYVREDVVEPTGRTNAAGAPIVRVKQDGTNIRTNPLIQDNVAPVGKASAGTEAAVLEETVQSNEMNWYRGPFSSDDLLASMKGKTSAPVSGPIQSLQITGRGPSGRVTEMRINGSVLPIKYPDSLRSALGGLPSTLFNVESTADMTMMGAGGEASVKTSRTSGAYVLGASGRAAAGEGNMFIMNGSGTIRPVTQEAAYRFTGNGSGHGLGLSQYGAKALADRGYDYQKILKYYYTDVTIVKD
ncbi:SpoIID/LytB domain-containing protein [Paenibacillus beijingensis]|uniref:Stage II sporulation protein SpoIID n=1 Tax=Paenibacillus beijingensis TaxID=1126833 RepID=A0A0D5NLP9_9BACL|nr:SpoIID/LytB domain-containing protein [Paenibacillus beijingensis]AJY76085.1 stage II sporulation protein SpoIID [Paenibacillus beijingensis]